MPYLISPVFPCPPLSSPCPSPLMDFAGGFSPVNGQTILTKPASWFPVYLPVFFFHFRWRLISVLRIVRYFDFSPQDFIAKLPLRTGLGVSLAFSFFTHCHLSRG